MWLLTPKWKSKNPQKRLKGFEKLNPNNPNHQKILMEFARKDPYYFIRLFSYKILGFDNTQDALADIAKNDNDRYVCAKAAGKLTDQSILSDIAKNAIDSYVRETAVEKLTDQSLLSDIAKKDEDSNVRWNAVYNLTDPIILTDISKNDEVFKVRQLAFEILGQENSQEAIADIAKNGNDADVRKAAVKKLTDQSNLADVAKNTHDSDTCVAAVKKLTNQSVLTDIAKNSEDIYTRFEATIKLTDLTLQIENLIQLLFFTKIKFKSKIAATLKELYQNKKISQEDKMKILSLKGSTLEEHLDYRCNKPIENCSIYNDVHTDKFQKSGFSI